MIRRLLIAFLTAAALLALVPVAHAADTQVAGGVTKEDEASYSALQQAIELGTVKSATLRPLRGLAEVELRDGSKLEVEYPPTDEHLAEDLAGAGAKVTVDNGKKTKPVAALMMVLLPILLLGALAFTLIRSRGNGPARQGGKQKVHGADRKSTRLNSSH